MSEANGPPPRITAEVASFAAGLRFEDIPPRVVDRTKAQILSVLGAVHAGRHSEGARAAHDVARTWGGGDDSVAFMTGERLPRHSAIFANACASVSFDFDDYLFAGHTGHSAVLAPLAYGGSGREVLTAMAVANEVGGRLGASLLFGPHNGQMWAYIHLLEGACAAGRLLGLDAEGIANAIGIAFTQPVYPLMPAFMGPDSKLLIPSSTTVEGVRAAELAKAGWTGAKTILEDSQGFLRRFNENNLGWMFSGFAQAWLSDSLTYKVVPGCAYVDTAVDSMREIMARFEGKHGRALRAGDVDSVHVRCALYTMGMETLCQRNRSRERLEPIAVNFSCALSFGLMLTAGTLAPPFLSHAYLDENRDAIERFATRVTVEHDGRLDRRGSEAAEETGFSLRDVLSQRKTLDGVSFEGYRMAFPAEVTLRTVDGDEWFASEDVPLGGSGRPWDETLGLVRSKFADHFPGDTMEAIAAVEALENSSDVTEVTSLLAAAP